MGDFNIDLLKYNQCNFSNQLFNQFSSSGFMQIIIKPTRITRSTATLIDNIFTTNLQQNEHLNGVILNDISDHLPIFSITDFETLQRNNTIDYFTSRIITNPSIEAFASKLQSYDWQSILTLHDPTESLNAFYNGFYDLYDKYFPVKKI